MPQSKTIYQGKLARRLVNPIVFALISQGLPTLTAKAESEETAQPFLIQGSDHSDHIENVQTSSVLEHRTETIQATTPDLVESPTPSFFSIPVSEPSQEVFPVGINLERRNVLPSVFVRGLTDDTQAVDLSAWQVPVSEVFEALNITANPLEDGQLELISPALVTRVKPDSFTVDPELGRVMSVQEIETLLGVPVSFDMVEYALVLAPPWLNQRGRSRRQAEVPVIVDGLPTVAAPDFSVSAVRQRTTLSNGNRDRINTQGDLSATGTALGGSWYVRVNQADLTNSATWRLSEAQYLRQTDAADYVVGSQPTFWPGQGSGSYWGVTTVQRFGFEPTNPGSGGFSPQRRLQSDDVGRTIAGEAEPGTLVQLVAGLDNFIIDEVLVDSSGIYRFEAVSTTGSRYFQVFLYANGQLTAEPEIRDAEFLALPGQLSVGTSALVVSAGGRQANNEDFLGPFQEATGGVAYRWGATEDLTLGGGAVYDESLLGFGELFYQPANLPLRVAVSALAGDDGIDYNANLFYNPSPEFNLTLSSDELSQRFRANWRVGRGLSLRASGNTREDALSVGASVSLNSKDFYLSGSGDIDTNGNLRWSLNSRWDKLQLTHRGNELTTDTDLTYSFSRRPSVGHTAFLAYDTREINDNYENLLQAGWRYRSQERNARGLNLWQFDLGYGVGSQGSGIIAAASTTVIPGMALRASYEEISTLSEQTTFRVELSPTLSVQPTLTLSDTSPEDLRGEGSLLVKPFLDTNGNGVWDIGEQIHTEDLDLLVLLDNQNTNRFRPAITSEGLFIQTDPGVHRVDLDPAGYPLDWRPTQRAYAVEVAAGGHTVVTIPLTRSYAVAGVITDGENEPIAGATVEAVSPQGGIRPSSVTNRAGVFFLEGLSQGQYELLINGESAQPQQIEFDAESPAFQELNLSLAQRAAAR
ncbi:MAG: carboxypeptidase-like regulatory domain-containing protein [Cyanobacteria bacterium J06635_1]